MALFECLLVTKLRGVGQRGQIVMCDILAARQTLQKERFSGQLASGKCQTLMVSVASNGEAPYLVSVRLIEQQLFAT